MSVIELSSSSLIPIEQHFRIAAGPGAGKTHWLIEHMGNVLGNSRRLGRTKKIACITYTNVAVETILRRIPFDTERVEVSTIHSFIYKNILKPYISFIAAEYSLDASKIEGHDDHFVSRKRVTDWINNHPNAAALKHPYSINQLTRRDENLKALRNWLSSIHYAFDGDQLNVKINNAKAFHFDGINRKNLSKKNCLDKLAIDLVGYKRLFWQRGILHHDDVLYFGYKLLKKHPFIVSVLRAKFPYFFVDEFQDTNPIQAEIVKMIGQNNTVVGLIGDKAQSIYSFQGASPHHFEQFYLPGLKDYIIADNRRSTNEIIKVLNHIRQDITQNSIRNVVGHKPSIFVGSRESALLETTRLLGTEDVIVLSRDNITSNAMKRHLNSELPTVNLVSELASIDSNSDRRRVVVSCINALELARQRRFKDAIKEMGKNFRSIQDRQSLNKLAFQYLAFLLSHYDSFNKKMLITFFDLIRTNIKPKTARLTRGAAFDFFNTYTFEQLAVCVKIPEDNSPSRTIHMSKGDEFENVLLLLKSQKDLQFILAPKLSIEENRVFYVAVSRSRNRLYLNVPELDVSLESRLKNHFTIHRLR